MYDSVWLDLRVCFSASRVQGLLRSHSGADLFQKKRVHKSTLASSGLGGGGGKEPSEFPYHGLSQTPVTPDES